MIVHRRTVADMTTGERDPAGPRVEAAAAVGWTLGYAVGYEAGYLAALDTVNQAWREASGRKVFAAGELLQQPTAAERRAARVAVLIEGHKAGLHVGRRVLDCPECGIRPERCTCTVLGIGTPTHERLALCLPRCKDHGQPMVAAGPGDWCCVCSLAGW